MTLSPSPVRVGFMPLVDSAPLVMASVLGFDRRHGVQLLLSRESSWTWLRPCTAWSSACSWASAARASRWRC